MNASDAMRVFIQIQTLACVLVGMSMGCKSKDSTFTMQQEIIRQSNDLSKKYLDANVRDAKEYLEKNAKLLEGAQILEPSGRASLLSLTYFRLYSLENRTSNELAAKATLIKARYWRLTAAELSGATQDDAVTNIEQLSNQRILDEVDQTDKKHNSGSPAKYVESLKRGVSAR
jgi:hypothetical protein